MSVNLNSWSEKEIKAWLDSGCKKVPARLKKAAGKKPVRKKAPAKKPVAVKKKAEKKATRKKAPARKKAVKKKPAKTSARKPAARGGAPDLSDFSQEARSPELGPEWAAADYAQWKTIAQHKAAVLESGPIDLEIRRAWGRSTTPAKCPKCGKQGYAGEKHDVVAGSFKTKYLTKKELDALKKKKRHAAIGPVICTWIKTKCGAKIPKKTPKKTQGWFDALADSYSAHRITFSSKTPTVKAVEIDGKLWSAMGTLSQGGKVRKVWAYDLVPRPKWKKAVYKKPHDRPGRKRTGFLVKHDGDLYVLNQEKEFSR